MIDLFTRWFARRDPTLSDASAKDTAAIAGLHAASFHRGWSDDEIERLLVDRQVVTHRAVAGGKLVGFIMSRLVRDEAEILSVAVARSEQGRGLARRLLDLHLRRLAGFGVRAVFLEVGEDNVAARRLYQRAGFTQVGRREGYYQEGPPPAIAALVLRHDL